MSESTTTDNLILGIETSCDETAAAVVGAGPGGVRLLSNVIASQDDLHAEYRGVVPEIASRAHAERILPIIRRALSDAAVTPDQLRAVAVGHRPGLIGCLLVGVAAAKTFAWSLGIPFVGVDHVQAHLYAGCLGSPGLPVSFPALGLVVSGGHTSIYRVDSFTSLTRLGATIDDAVGEAFDKAATVLGLPFPGGPNLDRLAELPGADPHAVKFPISRLSPDSLDFSFSGLKTALLYAAKGVPGERGAPAPPLTDERKRDLAASFRRAAVDALILKLKRALATLPAAPGSRRVLLTGGGVTRNLLLRARLLELASDENLDLRLPAPELCVDNAAMIAGLGSHLLAARRWTSDPLSLSADPTVTC